MREIVGRLTHIKGLRFRQLYICKDFYLTYTYFLRSVSAKSFIENKPIGIELSTQRDNSLQLEPELLLSRLNFSHFIELVHVEDELQRLFYEVETIKNNWSVRELKRAINTSLPFRTVMSTNKEAVIAKIKNLKPASNEEIIRNPYILEFLGLDEKSEYSETELEQQMRMDLIFYHRILKCHVFIDLKMSEFDYSDAGQMNVYLNYYKENEMAEGDNPPIGIILCAMKNDDDLLRYSASGMDDQSVCFQISGQTAGQASAGKFYEKGIESVISSCRFCHV